MGSFNHIPPVHPVFDPYHQSPTDPVPVQTPTVPAGAGLAPTPTTTVPPVPTTTTTATTVPAFNWTPTPYTGATRPQFNFGKVPIFTPPQFNAPTGEEAFNSPGYKFRLQQGEQALEASAAAKGLLRTGGTLESILGFGQNAASQEYQNVFQRALDAYDRQYGAAKDAYTPQYNSWALKSGAEQAGGLAAFNQGINMYQFPITEERLREQMLLEAQARAAAGA